MKFLVINQFLDCEPLYVDVSGTGGLLAIVSHHDDGLVVHIEGSGLGWSMLILMIPERRNFAVFPVFTALKKICLGGRYGDGSMVFGPVCNAGSDEVTIQSPTGCWMSRHAP